MKENIENFNKLVSDKKSGWLEKAIWKEENEAWLDKSAKIAIRILREIRSQKKINGMTQKKLAEAMGVSPQYVNKVVKGQENLTIETITKIEKVLNIVLMEVPSIDTKQIYTDVAFPQTNTIPRTAARIIGSKKFPYSMENNFISEDTQFYSETGS